MSIRARVNDAELLWQHGRKEGAWVMALVAAAGTARLRYPPPMKSQESFERFIRDVLPTLMFAKSLQGVPNPVIVFGDIQVERLVYVHLRCNLFHEGGLKEAARLSESSIVDGKLQATLAVGTEGSPHLIPDFWAINLLKAIREAPENASAFPAGQV